MPLVSNFRAVLYSAGLLLDHVITGKLLENFVVPNPAYFDSQSAELICIPHCFSFSQVQRPTILLNVLIVSKQSRKN